MSSLSWEKSCYDAVVQLRALLEDSRFTFANIISVMKELDLGKQSEQTRRAQIPVKSPNKITQVLIKYSDVAQELSERREEDNLVIASINGSAMETDNDVLLPERANKDERKANESEVQDEPMEIVENDDRTADSCQFAKTTIGRQVSVSIHELIVNRTALSSPDTADRDPAIANPSSCPQSPMSDPRFYVCTSFAKTIPPHRETDLGGSSFATSSIAISPSISFNKSSQQSFQYHDYCLSEGEFDITLPSQSTPSDVARRNARLKEAEIFRQIEGDAFDENSFFNDTQVPLEMDLTADDDM